MTDFRREKHWPQLLGLADSLVKMDYFQILNVGYDAETDAIRKQYYIYARALHPDRFVYLNNAQVSQAVNAIYRRMNEAYLCLRDESKRSRYYERIQGEGREVNLRYTSEQEFSDQREKEASNALVSTPQAKTFVDQAQVAIAAQDWSKAMQALKSAELFEPTNTKLKAAIAQVATQLERDT